ncbi:MAG: hypothetical protein ACLRPU_05015 [Enterococcus hulanensis]
MAKYEVTTIELTCTDLATIIEGLYYGGDEDLSHTEDLIDHLKSRPDQAVQLETSKKIVG